MCVIKAALRSPRIKIDERRQFAQEFMSLVLQKKHIWLIDETSVKRNYKYGRICIFENSGGRSPEEILKSKYGRHLILS